MQCKDIPDLPILEYILKVKQDYNRWTCIWYGKHHECHDVYFAMPENTPPKLALAKMRQLLKRGLVNGCGCGCRGDFEITKKGEDYLRGKK